MKQISLLALFMLGILAGCTGLSKDMQLSEKGFQSMSQGDYQQAESYLQQALAINPNNPYALLNLGVVYQNSGQYQNARELYEKLIELNPNATASNSNITQAKGKTLVEIARGTLRQMGFVSAKAPAVDLDSDGDGILDKNDKCPHTPAGVSVDEAGCARDSDEDGVPNVIDRCPDTPLRANVNRWGCWVIEGFIFATSQAVIKPQAYPALEEVVSILTENPQLKIEIEGHTDNKGPAKLNQRLSEERAQAVLDYLTKHGIASDRLTAVGYGFSKPIASNDTPEGRARNRRVELKPLP